MSFCPTILAQVKNFIDRLEFVHIVKDKSGDRYVKKITCERLMTLLFFTNLAEIKSMRHLQASLDFMRNKLYHLDLCEMSLNGISQALMNRPSSVFREFFYSMQSKFKRQRLKLDKNLKRFVSILDATSMPFGGLGSEWAKAGKQRCEAKAHCLIDANGKPLDMVVTGASVHDSRGFKKLNLGKTEILLMDRAYYGFNLWHDLCLRRIKFITRAKSKMRYEVIKNRPGRRPKGVIEDQIIRFYSKSGKDYLTLRRITMKTEKGVITFISNDLHSPAKRICDLYKMRWEIEVFFKWIKQNLKIKRFLGRNRNAIEIQLWTALIVYLTLFIIKKLFGFKGKILYLIRKIKHSLLERIEMANMLSPPKSRSYGDGKVGCLF